MPNGRLFDFYNNEIIISEELKMTTLSKAEKEILIQELFILHSFGFVYLVRNPSKNEKCYFWNGKNKLEATKDKKPFISQFLKIEDEKFSAKNCNFLFRYCEPVENPFLNEEA